MTDSFFYTYLLWSHANLSGLGQSVEKNVSSRHMNSHIRCVRPLYVYISCINVPNFIASSTPSGRGFVVCTASCFLTHGGKNVNWQLHGATRPPPSRPQRDDDGSGSGDALSRACCDLVRYVLRDYRTYARTPSAIIHRTNSDGERERKKDFYPSNFSFVRS